MALRKRDLLASALLGAGFGVTLGVRSGWVFYALHIFIALRYFRSIYIFHKDMEKFK